MHFDSPNDKNWPHKYLISQNFFQLSLFTRFLLCQLLVSLTPRSTPDTCNSCVVLPYTQQSIASTKTLLCRYQYKWLYYCGLFFSLLSILDFDEKCSQEDDWDVDMSLYYTYGKFYNYGNYGNVLIFPHYAACN